MCKKKEEKEGKKGKEVERELKHGAKRKREKEGRV